ncbi:MAG: OmpA family protein, partial [candidate division Zixibacteria bacterium]|nr:OmpA family protein [candidate division Zixibacteria bacterium]
MNRKGLIAILMVILLSATGTAADLKGKTIVGVKVPVFLPLYNGSDFDVYGHRYQPFMMGWDFGFDVKHGFSNRVMLGFTANYRSTYDDSTSVDNAGDKFNNTDNATVKLSGIGLGVQGEWYYDPVWRFQPYLLVGLGVDLWSVKNRATNDSYKSTDFGFKVGTGLLFPFNDKLSMDLQVKLTRRVAKVTDDVPIGFYGPDTWASRRNRPFNGYLEPSIGLSYFFGGELDSDHDGVADSKDKCPDTPRGVKVDKTGCPLDADGDGVADYLDKCLGTPAGVKVDQNGCPLDSDRDGVPDYVDKCPNTPAGVKVDSDGCAPDADGDGVPDQLDKCPDTPKGAPVDLNGCPLDSDRDGVADYLDKCPGTPMDIKVDTDGCPLVKKITEKITLNIRYASNSFEPDADSRHQLDSIAERIVAYPETKIAIAGFTDDRGTEQNNMTLSQNRANGVMTYLQSKGVTADRMTAKGYGEDPKYFVADNKTEAGRARNRRVEIESV